MKTNRSNRGGFTLFEVLLSVAIFAVLALMLTSALYLVVRSQGFTLVTNDNTNNAGQIMNRIVHGVGTHRPLREAYKDSARISPSAGGGWTLEYTVQNSDTWIRYIPRSQTIINSAGRVLGEDVVGAGATTNSVVSMLGAPMVDSVDLWLSVQGSSNGRALTETISTRVQLRNFPAIEDEEN